MTFHSILFARPEDGVTEKTLGPPAFFGDLNLDQMVSAITAGWEEYNLEPFFYAPLNELDAITYRHEVMRDLENHLLFEHITSFARGMCAMRKHLAQAAKLYYKYQRERWFLEAVEIYCETVSRLAHELAAVKLTSRGFLAFRAYLANYATSDRFSFLVTEARKLEADLSAVKYSLLIQGDTVTVGRYEGQPDYSREVDETFARFKQGAVKDYSFTFTTSPEMNHIEAKVLDFVAQLYPDTFLALDHYYASSAEYLDETLARFDREIQFYVAYLDYIAPLQRAGLSFCYPTISRENKAVYDYDGFDVALAHQLIAEDSPIVCNDFYLKDEERIVVVTGPNQGGKTTFARAFGQLHYLASLGCPVPGREARLFLYDRLFTHFEKEEDITTLRGKLEDDLIRLSEILTQATSESIIVMNEIFTSTTLADAKLLSTKVLKQLVRLDLLSVWVTFIDELASFDRQTVSMVAMVAPDDPTLRTYKIVRRPADGLAYAMSIAEKYRLTHDRVKERIKS
jgi:DNA mismatch repair protein MutS